LLLPLPLPLPLPAQGHYPAAWALSGDRQTVGWSIGSERFDLYLLPSASLKAGTSAYYNLTGAPKVLPRYAYGFMACRWGWDRSDRPGESAPGYIERMLTDFRAGSFPIDAWISDFEWYTDEPDYNLPQAGTETFTDFWFNNITFPEPVALVEKYRAAPLHLRFGGIRKPRLGNTNSLIMARALDWTLPGQGGGGAAGGSRNLNYTRADVQAWYAAQQLPLLDAGVEFWWNDEGEATYFTFFHWNAAEIATLRGFAPGKRFLSINRAFTPGMSRQGAVTWTGDVQASWDDLQRTPGYVLNWGLAGSAHVTCDIGGFNGETTALLLTRWMQAGVFIPVMRVHSTRSAVPHFPFLWGDDAAAAMRLALNLRYQLVPYHYSNAHAAYASGVPMMRPMALDFEHDAYAASLTSQWMDGDAVLVAPVLREDNSTVVYFPQLPRGGGGLHPERRGVWFDWCNSSFHQGPLNLTITGAALDEVPRYVRSGSIVPLAPVVQYTDALPGGPLQLHIYSGADAEFVLVEDDGETDAYERGAVRRTTFSYDNEGGNLYTHVAGDFAGDAHTFTHFTTFLYTPDGHWPEDDDGPSSSAAATEEVLHPMGGKPLRIRLHPPRR
jgi:alpha-glucosidase